MSNGTSVGYLRTSFHGKGRRGHRDTLQFAQEIGGVSWLVVAAHLPYHAIAILVVVP